ncbi:PREDICTED: putative fatty acyl-CoA reductase CG5065 [Polistes dominula]|uniref:Fatty acyl-CoA reductase n=1 Tax=Polistes dominula TaxID=743375 RepID=A0ABM1IDL8_POLDO|nr:PREDICTED: putative fatty acyl-CoA reductase CG5065 [Polistes dominula]
MNDNKNYVIRNVAKFFAGRSIFITGGTGFIGKVLIEKLLRSCPEIDKLYLLIRDKKGVNIEERLKKIFSLPLFDKLNEMNPSAYKKIVPIFGDITKKNLGMNPIDRQIIIDNVSIIIHNAANVRFDDDLQNAIFTNTRSIHEICLLGESMKKLEVLLHISSTYAHCDKPVVHEIPYKPSDFNWMDAIKIAENVDDYLLRVLTSKLIGNMPNTYIFTKKLAEDVINYYSDRLPCVICRPSIVINTIDDPIPGWIDNFNGPVGLMVAGGKGLLNGAYFNSDKVMDYIPVDLAVKVFILAIYTRGQKTVEQHPTAMVYNESSYKLKKITLQYIISKSLEYNQINPLSNPLWYPTVIIFSNFYLYYIYFIFLQLLPAMVIDQILKLMGHKPILAKIQRKIYISSVFLSYFIDHSWDFVNEKAVQLLDSVAAEDRVVFASKSIYEISEDNALKSSILGSKKYLLKEEMNIEKNQRGLRRMWYLHIITRTLFYIFCLWLVLHMWNLI